MRFPAFAIAVACAGLAGAAGAAPADAPTRESGTVSMWVTPKDGKWRDVELFSLPCGGPGAGTIRLSVDRKRFVVSRDCAGIEPVTVEVPKTGGRTHLLLTWDDCRENIYVNGYCHRYCSVGIVGLMRDVAPFKPSKARPDKKPSERRTFAEGSAGEPSYLGGKNAKGYALEVLRASGRYSPMMAAVNEYRALGVPRPPVPDYAKEYAGHVNPYVKDTSGMKRELVEEIVLDENGVAALEKANRFKIVGPRQFGVCDGTAYLETGKKKDERFAVAFDIDATHPLYEIEFAYPDDAVRTVAITVQTRNGWGADSTLQVGYCTGDDHPLSRKIRSYRCLYWTGAANDKNPEPCGKLAAVVTKRYAVRDTGGAALAAIRVYRVSDGKLPRLAIPQLPKGVEGRHFAVNYEDPAIGCDFGTRYTTGRGEEQEKMIDRMIAVMRYTGQDRFHYPRAWYYGFNDPYDEIPANPRGWHPHGWYEAWYAKFDHEGLGFVPTMHPHGIPFDPAILTEGSETDGSLHPTAASISDTGEVEWAWGSPKSNFAHPATRAYIDELFDKILAEGAKHPSFKGIELRFTEVGILCWVDERQGYNDYAVKSFAKSIGVGIPRTIDARDPLRGAAYAQWLRENHWEAWLDWRCGFVTRQCEKLAKKLRDARPDAKLYLDCALTIRPNRIPWINENYYKPGFWPRYIRGMGLDVKALSRIEGVVMTQMTIPSDRRWFPNLKPDQFAKIVERDGLAENYPMTQHSEYAAYYCFDRYWESPAGRSYGKGSPMELSCAWLKEIPWQVVTINASGANSMRPFAMALKVRDWQELMKGGYLIGTYGMEPYLRPFMAAFRALPAVPFENRASSSPDVTVRGKTVAGRDYLYTVNTCAEPRKVRLAGKWKDLVTGEVVSGGEIALGPYALRSFAASAKTRAR